MAAAPRGATSLLSRVSGKGTGTLCQLCHYAMTTDTSPRRRRRALDVWHRKRYFTLAALENDRRDSNVRFPRKKRAFTKEKYDWCRI